VTRKPNLAKCILGVVVLAFLFVGTWASTNALRSNAQDQAQKQGPTVNAPPTPTPTPGAPPAGVAHVFEIDGNVCDDSAEGTDWNEVNPPTDPACTPGFISGDPDGAGPIQLATFVIDTCENDRVFTIGSSKDFNDIEGNWHSTIGSVPDKDEITHAYAAISIVPTNPATTADGTAGHTILTFGGDRLATNGDANIGFWFFQSPVGIDPATGDFQGNHVNGDLFIVSAFTGGGGTSTIDVYEWVGTPLSGAAALCTSLGGTLDNAGTLCKLSATANKGTGIVNPVDLGGACPGGGGLDWPFTAKGDRTPCTSGPCDAPKGSFYEGGLDLTEVGLGGTCFSTFMLETRSSATVDAILKDFALGSFNTCACSVTPATASVCDGSTTQFCAVDPQGAPGPFTYLWDTGETTQCITTGVAGTHTVEITDSLGNKTSCSGTLTVTPSPIPSVTVDTSCADSIILTASGGTQFNWDGGGFSATASIAVSTGPSTHTVVVKNAAGCEATKTVHIGLCCRDCDGITP
jgi:hypothetical protein